MESNSEKLARKLAELQRRNQAKESQAVLEVMLSAHKGAVLKGFVGGAIHSKVNEFWIVFADCTYEPFSTLSDMADLAYFKQWVQDCYKSAGSPKTILLSISNLCWAELAEVEIHSIEEWVEYLKNYLTSNSMNFDILLATPSADVVLELWEEENHYSAFLFQPDGGARR